MGYFFELENTRKRKAPTRPDSISSEWIGCHVGRVPKLKKVRMHFFQLLVDTSAIPKV